MLVDLAQVSKSVRKQEQMNGSGNSKKLLAWGAGEGWDEGRNESSGYLLGSKLCQKMFLIFSRYLSLSILISPELDTGYFGRVRGQAREGKLTLRTLRPS